jgi:hypothetical protein
VRNDARQQCSGAVSVLHQSVGDAGFVGKIARGIDEDGRPGIFPLDGQ